VVEEMAKEKFEIGETEKHLIVVDWDWFMKHITIELDGEKVVDEFHYSPMAKKVQLDVGSSEKHRVEISAGEFSPIKVFVDGKAAQKT
jgi:hypothetical protein